MAAGLDLDALMERASGALVAMDYFECEALCVEALAEARRRELWALYARIVLPLQEARRQRRMLACDGGVCLERHEGTQARRHEGAETLENGVREGVVLVMPRLGAGSEREVASALWMQALHERRAVEVMWVARAEGEAWDVTSFAGPEVRVRVEPLRAGASPERAVQWYLNAHEALGDAAIAAVDEGGESMGSVARVDALAAMVDAVPDHEKLHQRLAEAAIALV